MAAFNPSSLNWNSTVIPGDDIFNTLSGTSLSTSFLFSILKSKVDFTIGLISKSIFLNKFSYFILLHHLQLKF